MGTHSLLVIALVLAVAGCSRAPAAAPAPHKSNAHVDGLERVENSAGGLLLVKRDHHMASYDQLMVDPVAVTFAGGSSRLSRSETQRLEAHLRKATAQELVNVDPSKVVTAPGPCVVRMQTAFVDLELPPGRTLTGSSSGFVKSHGSVTLVHEVRDSMTGTVLMRYVGRVRAEGGPTVGTSSWRGLSRTFYKMLSALQEALVESVPISTATEGPLAQCQGLINKGIEER